MVVVWWAGVAREWVRLERGEGRGGVDCMGLWRSSKDCGFSSTCVGKPLEGFGQENNIISNLCFKRIPLATEYGQDYRRHEWEQKG